MARNKNQTLSPTGLATTSSIFNHYRTSKSQAPDVTKTMMQTRQDGMLKPKAYNAWDMLALNDLIRKKIEDHESAEQMKRIRNGMRNHYDQQVFERQCFTNNEIDKDKRLGKHITQKVHMINTLAEFENRQKLKKRQTVAQENLSQSRALQKKREAERLKNMQEDSLRAQMEHNLDMFRQKQQNQREKDQRSRYMNDISTQIFENKVKNTNEFNQNRN